MKMNLIISKMALSLFIVIAFSSMMNAQCETHQVLLDNMNQTFNEKNSELLANIYHTDVKKYTPDGVVEGLAAMQKGAERFYVNVPDATRTIHETVCSGDKIILRWEGNGTPKMSGKPAKVSGITIYRVVDGKIAEEWEEMSTLSLMMQMGFELKEPEKKD